jgi:hypothetical protein
MSFLCNLNTPLTAVVASALSLPQILLGFRIERVGDGSFAGMAAPNLCGFHYGQYF